MANLLIEKGRFHELVWSGLEKDLTAKEIRRYVQLAGVLEPLSEKEGCTTRTKDLSQFQKLEYFLTAAVNIGAAFEDLANRVLHEFPTTTYDLAYRAQTDSKKNRRGGRVNQGIIEFLFPLIISQLFYKEKTPEEIISKVPYALEHTKPEDTIWLQKMQNLAFEMSGYYERVFPVKENRTILDYYRKRLDTSLKPSDVFHNREIVDNYPTLREMIEHLKRYNSESSLSDKMRQIYNETRSNSPNRPLGIIADLNACLIYLTMSCERTSKLVD